MANNTVRSATQDIAPKGRTPRSRKVEATTSDVVKNQSAAPTETKRPGRQPEMFKGRPWRDVAAENKQNLSNANGGVKAARKALSEAENNVARAGKALERARKDAANTDTSISAAVAKAGAKRPNDEQKTALATAKQSVKNAEAAFKAAVKAHDAAVKDVERAQKAAAKVEEQVKKIESQRAGALN